MKSYQKIAILGAGMAGLSCAHHLREAGLNPVVFEKSGRPGGRMSTRVTEKGFVFDHGAQFFRAKGHAFAQFVTELEAQGHAKTWDAIANTDPVDPIKPMKVGNGAMNELFVTIAKELDIRFRTLVEQVTETSSGFNLHIRDSETIEVFDKVISTIPVEQVRSVFCEQEDLLQQCSSVSLQPCWAGLFGFDEKLECGFDTWRHVSSDIGWIARNSSKPGRDASKDAWVVHASPRWTLTNLERDKGQVANDLFLMFSDAMNVSVPDAAYLDAHRWRYAQTPEPLGKPFLTNPKQSVFFGGDWCLGARVEAAFESGAAIAEAVLSTR